MVTGCRSVADWTAASINAMVPRLCRPEVSGSRPVSTDVTNSVIVPNPPVRGVGVSEIVRDSPLRGVTTTLSWDGSLSAALVHTISPFSNCMRHSPAHGVIGPAVIQLPRYETTTPPSKTIEATATGGPLNDVHSGFHASQ